MNNNVNFELLYKQLLEENNQLKKENNQLKGEVKWLKDKEDGELYQDNIFYTLSVVLKMKINGKDIKPLQWSSKKYQTELGESYEGIEVKHDKRSVINNKEMGNVFIATLENGLKKKTGILQTQGIFYAIGNDYFAYIFKTDDLKLIYNRLKEGRKFSNYFLYNNGDKEGIIIKKDCLREVMKEYRKEKYDLNDYTVTAIPVYKPFLYNNKMYPVNAYKDDKQAVIECKKIEAAYKGIRDIIER